MPTMELQAHRERIAPSPTHRRCMAYDHRGSPDLLLMSDPRWGSAPVSSNKGAPMWCVLTRIVRRQSASWGPSFNDQQKTGRAIIVTSLLMHIITFGGAVETSGLQANRVWCGQSVRRSKSRYLCDSSPVTLSGQCVLDDGWMRFSHYTGSDIQVRRTYVGWTVLERVSYSIWPASLANASRVAVSKIPQLES